MTGSRPAFRLLGPVLFGVAIGIVVLMTGLLLIVAPQASPERLTFNGVHNLRPERDTLLYLGSGAVAVVSALLIARRRGSVHLAWWFPLPVAGGAVVVAVAVFLAARSSLPLDAPASLAVLCLSIALVAVCAVAAGAGGHGDGAPEPLRTDDGRPRRPGVGPLDLLVAAIVIALLYVPGWRDLAGNAFLGEGALHLDFFAFGPALGFASGGALGTDLHTYYGFGWGVVFASLDPLSYGHIIRLEVVYGCLYFIGVYALLRALVGDRRWAAAGTALAVLLQLFAGYPSSLVLWRFPSATVLRWPFDVWFFLACLFHLRTGRTAWTVTAGVLVALAVVFQTDTGLALSVAFALYWFCVWRRDGRRILGSLAWSAAAAGCVLVVGLGVASRWTMLSGAFWGGWLENLRLSAAGATLLPLSTAPTAGIIAWFTVLTAGYLAVMCHSAVLLARRRISTSTVLLGCIATYGFLTLVYFVGRSNPHNLFRPTVPFAVLVGACGGLAHQAWVRRAEDGEDGDRRAGVAPAAAAWAAWVAVGASVVMLAANPGVRAYPGLIRSVVAGDEEGGICLFEDPDDVCGLPPDARSSVDDLRALAARLRALGSATTSVAVLDQIGPVIQHMAGARPWGRYLPVFPGLFTRAQVGAVLDDLRQDPPALVVMRSRAEEALLYADIWLELRGPVERGFVLDSRSGPFEIWRRRP